MITRSTKNNPTEEENPSDMSNGVDLEIDLCSLDSDYEAAELLLFQVKEPSAAEEEEEEEEEPWCNLSAEEHQSKGKTQQKQAQVGRSERVANPVELDLVIGVPSEVLPSFAKEQRRCEDSGHSGSFHEDETENEFLAKTEARKETASSLQENPMPRRDRPIATLDETTDDFTHDTPTPAERHPISSEETNSHPEAISNASSNRKPSPFQTGSIPNHRQLRYVALCIVPVAFALVFYDRYAWKQRTAHLHEQLIALRHREQAWEKERDRLSVLLPTVLLLQNRRFEVQAKDCSARCPESIFDNPLFCEEEQHPPTTVLSVDNCWVQAKASFELGYCPRRLTRNVLDAVRSTGQVGQDVMDAVQDTTKSVVNRAGSAMSDFLKSVMGETTRNFPGYASGDAISRNANSTDPNRGVNSTTAEAFGENSSDNNDESGFKEAEETTTERTTDDDTQTSVEDDMLEVASEIMEPFLKLLKVLQD